MGALIPICANTYGQTDHVWRELIGGRQCEVCGEQQAIAYFKPAELRLAELYLSRVIQPKLVLPIGYSAAMPTFLTVCCVKCHEERLVDPPFEFGSVTIPEGATCWNCLWSQPSPI